MSSSSSENDQNPNNTPEMKAPATIYSCRYCSLTFSTPMALGGHQNAHKSERDAEKKKSESTPNQSSPFGTIFESSSSSSRWLEQFPETWRRRRTEEHFGPMMFAPFSAHMVCPSAPMAPRPLALFPSAPMAPRPSAGPLALFPTVPGPSRSAPLAPPPPAGMAPLQVPLARRPDARSTMMYEFLGPSDAARNAAVLAAEDQEEVEEEEEEEEDINLDLKL